MANAQQHYDEGLRNLCKSQGNKSALWYGQAIRDLGEAITADPGMVQAYAMRAVCHAALGDVAKANEDKAMTRQLEAVGSSQRQSDREAAQAFYQKARQGMDGGGLIGDALYYLQKAIDADLGFADAYDARSDVYFNLGMADESLADIKRVGQLKLQQVNTSSPSSKAIVAAASVAEPTRQIGQSADAMRSPADQDVGPNVAATDETQTPTSLTKAPLKHGIAMLAAGVVLLLLSPVIAGIARGMEAGFISGVFNGLFLSGFILPPLGVVFVIYGLSTRRRRAQQKA